MLTFWYSTMCNRCRFLPVHSDQVTEMSHQCASTDYWRTFTRSCVEGVSRLTRSSRQVVPAAATVHAVHCSACPTNGRFAVTKHHMCGRRTLVGGTHAGMAHGPLLRTDPRGTRSERILCLVHACRRKRGFLCATITNDAFRTLQVTRKRALKSKHRWTH